MVSHVHSQTPVRVGRLGGSAHFWPGGQLFGSSTWHQCGGPLEAVVAGAGVAGSGACACEQAVVITRSAKRRKRMALPERATRPPAYTHVSGETVAR